MQENNKNYTPFLLIAIFVALIFTALVFAKMNQNTQAGKVTNLDQLGNEVSPSADLSVSDEEAKTYLFTSETCPHCQKVAAYLDDNPQVYQKAGLQRKKLDDLLEKEKNTKELTTYASNCGIVADEIGIPFLYINDEKIAAQNRCLSGDQAIIDYFQAQVEK